MLLQKVAQTIVMYAKKAEDPISFIEGQMHRGMTKTELAARVLALRVFDEDYKFDESRLMPKPIKSEYVVKREIKPVERVENIFEGEVAQKFESAFSRAEIAKEGPQAILVRAPITQTPYTSKGRKSIDHGYYTKARWNPKPGWKNPCKPRWRG